MPEIEATDSFVTMLARLPAKVFSTADFVVEYRMAHSDEWRIIELQHGAGGKGAGQHRTVFTHVAHKLSMLSRQGLLDKLDYRPAPDWWGNRVVQFWSTDAVPESDTQATEAVDTEYREGSLSLRTHLHRERHWGLAKKKKEAFIAEHGKLFCQRCKLVPGDAFGLPIGNAIIEVHHATVTVGAMTTNHRTKLGDLECICANCHRLAHAEMSEAASN